MRLWTEIAAFGTLAAGLHLALFAAWSGGAPDAAGDGGAGTLTLTGSAGAIEAMVAAWDAPPAVAEAVALRAPAALTLPAARPAAEAAPDRAPAPARPATIGETPAPPSVPDAPSPLPVPAAASLAPRMAPPAGSEAPAGPARTAAPERAAPPRPPAPETVAGAPATAQAPPAPAQAPPAPATRPRARPEQVAAGAGASGVRGTRAEAPVPGLSEGARRSIVASWGAEIRARIEARKVHPEGLRASGRPVVRITVARSGALEEVRVIRSSRVAAIDEAAVRAVRGAGTFPAAPGDLDLARVSFDLPISFTR